MYILYTVLHSQPWPYARLYELSYLFYFCGHLFLSWFVSCRSLGALSSSCMTRKPTLMLGWLTLQRHSLLKSCDLCLIERGGKSVPTKMDTCMASTTLSMYVSQPYRCVQLNLSDVCMAFLWMCAVQLYCCMKQNLVCHLPGMCRNLINMYHNRIDVCNATRSDFRYSKMLTSLKWRIQMLPEYKRWPRWTTRRRREVLPPTGRTQNQHHSLPQRWPKHVK